MTNLANAKIAIGWCSHLCLPTVNDPPQPKEASSRSDGERHGEADAPHE